MNNGLVQAVNFFPAHALKNVSPVPAIMAVNTLEPVKTDAVIADAVIADAEINEADIPSVISSVSLDVILSSVFLGVMTSVDDLAPRKDGVTKDGSTLKATGPKKQAYEAEESVVSPTLSRERSTMILFSYSTITHL